MNKKVPIRYFQILGIKPQTYGQLSGSLFYATGQTKLYRNIGITTMLLGTVATFFLLGPQEYGGLNLGAIGLAIKTIAIQFIGVNIGLWFNTKYLKTSYSYFLIHQLGTVVLLCLFSYIALVISSILTNNIIFSFLVSGIIYSILATLLVLLFPKIAAISRKELVEFINQLKKQ